MTAILRRGQSRAGFSLAEVIMALGLAAVALLALLAQSALFLGSNQKTENITVGTDVAYTILGRFARDIATDSGGIQAEAHGHSSVINNFRQGAEDIGGTTFTWEIFLVDVTDATTSETVGTGPTGAENVTRLKRMEILVSWWEQTDNTKQGQGRLEVKATRLLSVRLNAP